MNTARISVTLAGLWLALVVAAPTVHAQIAPGELVAPLLEISGGNLNFAVRPSVSGRNYHLQYSGTMAGGTWQDLGMARSGDGSNLVISTPYVAGASRRFFRLLLTEVITPPVPDGFALIPAGSFLMGDSVDGVSSSLPVHTVQVSASYVVKWCNARSEKEGLVPCFMVSGVTYRTTDNWAVVCNWSANGYPCTPPVGSFAPNGYGLYDIAGNLWEWCWDWWGSYTAGAQTDPRGPATGPTRMPRGGKRDYRAGNCRVAARNSSFGPTVSANFIGFRLARSSVP